MIYLTLFYEFAKIGLFSIGGGLATLPFLNALAEKYNWYTKEMLVKIIAIAESTPGPIGVNMSAYAGYHAAGILGGIIATFGLVFPSLIFMIFITRMLVTFDKNKYVENAFYGLRPAVAALIAYAGFGIVTRILFNLAGTTKIGEIITNITQSETFLSIFNLKGLILFAVLLSVSLYFKKLQPLVLIASAAVVGIIFKF